VHLQSRSCPPLCGPTVPSAARSRQLGNERASSAQQRSARVSVLDESRRCARRIQPAYSAANTDSHGRALFRRKPLIPGIINESTARAQGLRIGPDQQNSWRHQTRAASVAHDAQDLPERTGLKSAPALPITLSPCRSSRQQPGVASADANSRQANVAAA